jgi:seryl-tRNA synthetase
MLDIRFIRENPDVVRRDLEKRGSGPDLFDLLERTVTDDKKARQLTVETEKLRHERNEITDSIAKVKKEGGDIPAEIRERSKQVPARIKEIETELDALKEEIHQALLRIPNILHDSVPFGKDENDNAIVKSFGEETKHDFAPKGHEEILTALDMLDIERAAKISGSRFYFLKNDLVMLDYAIIRMALEHLQKRGFTTIEPPYIMGHEPYMGVTDLGTFEEMLYTLNGDGSHLIATSEHPIAAMHMEETFLEEGLPLRYAGISACFRKEAGAHGKDSKGIFRVHQFNKIEQFIFCKPEDSWKFHEELLENTEQLFQMLELPYRIVNVCTGDIGIIAAKKYDLEAWMPVQGAYREMASCSNCLSYQATRLNIRVRKAHGTPSDFVHTLNSTGIATSRAIVALVENFQTKDGTVNLPKALWPYMGGKKELRKITATFPPNQ